MEDRSGQRRRLHRPVGEHEEHVHAAELFHPAPLDRIEEHDLVAALAHGLRLRDQAARVIAAALRLAGPAGRGADIFARHPQRHAWCIGLEIGADRGSDDRVDELGRRAHAEERAVGDHERPQVERAILGLGYPFAVGADEPAD